MKSRWCSWSMGARFRLPIAIFFASSAYLLARAPGPSFFLYSFDQGYQLAMGVAVCEGRFPGVDFFTHYGPLVAVSSCIGLAATGSALGEVLICAVAYAAAIALSAAFIRRHANAWFGILAAVLLLALFPRYYKWYYWWFPLLALSFADAYYWSVRRGEHCYVICAMWGATTGTAFLFRPDLGAAESVFAIVVIAFVSIAGQHCCRPENRIHNAARRTLFFAGGALGVPIVYLLMLDAVGGAVSMQWFLQSTVDAMFDVVEYYSIAPFQFDLSKGLSEGNCTAALQVIVPVMYGLSLAWSIRRYSAAAGRERHEPEAFALLVLSLLGLSLFPQAMHRADLQHLLQVLPPFALLVLLLSRRAVLNRARSVRSGLPACVLLQGAVPTAAILLLVSVVRGASMDLEPFVRDYVGQWRLLLALPASRPDDPVADMAEALRRCTSHDNPIFLAMSTTQMPMLFFARRYQSGLFPTYEPGLFQSAVWKERNRQALLQNPPRYLVVRRDEWPLDSGHAASLAPYIPDVIKNWESEYTVVVHQNERYELLGRPDFAETNSCFPKTAVH